jgi:hypothetical protein
MIDFFLIIGIILLGIFADAAISKVRNGEVRLSRGWYIILGLALAFPTMGYPFALYKEIQNPNPNIQTPSIPFTIAFFLGCYLIFRFFQTKGSNSALAHGATTQART